MTTETETEKASALAPINLDDLLPFEVEMHLNCTVAQLPTSLRKQLPASQQTGRRGHNTVCIPSSQPVLIDTLARHGREGIGAPRGTVTMIVRGQATWRMPAWVVVHHVTKSVPSPFAVLRVKFVDAVQQARRRGIPGVEAVTTQELLAADAARQAAANAARASRIERARRVLVKLHSLSLERQVELVADHGGLMMEDAVLKEPVAVAPRTRAHPGCTCRILINNEWTCAGSSRCSCACHA